MTDHGGEGATTARDRAVGRFALSWTILGLVTSGTVAVLVVQSGLGNPVRLAAVAAVTVLAELIELRFQWSERATSAFTLVESGVAASLLLLPGGEALLATVGAVALVQVLRRRPPLKAGFNLGQMAAGVAVAALVVTFLPPVGPRVVGRAVLSVVLGMVLYGLVNLAALAGLLQQLTGEPPLATLREHGGLTAAAIGGNTAVGVLLAALWVTQPELIPALLVPTAAIHLAYRGTVRTDVLLTRVRAEAERLDRIVLGTSDGIVLLDAAGRIEVWNRAMQEMTGIGAEEAVGSPVDRVLTTQVRDGREITGRWLMGEGDPGEPVHQELVRLHHVDGSDRTVRERHTLLFDDRGHCVGDVILLHDVTRQREVERLKSDFVARISHELRTPLTPIKGFAQLLLERDSQLTQEQRRDALDRISHHSDRLTTLVEDLLLVSQLDGESVGSPSPGAVVDLVGTARRTLERLRTQHPDRALILRTTPGAPSGTEAVRGLGDPERIEHVLGSLVDNAIRYTPTETPVEIECFDDDDEVGIHVIDHGPGIPFGKHEAIFERFHRLEDPLRMRTSGVGLGLFIARRLAIAMHGSLTVDSRPGSGATFTLRLPAAPPERASEHPAPPPEEHASRADPGGSPNMA